MLQRLVEILQDQAVLDTLADAVQPPLREAVRQKHGAGAAVKTFLSGTWLGHPLHPILKDVPIGAWTMAAIFDALESDIGHGEFAPASDICVATGLAGALASAVTGLADWSDTRGHARRIGVAHALLNITATSLYAASLALRRNHRASAVGISYAGFAIMLLGAYLGGHLVFGEQIGVNHAVEESLPTNFIPVLPENALREDEPQRVSANGLPIVLVRQKNRVHALLDRCAHMGGPLSEGPVEGDTIRCPWHGSRFCLEDGGVVEGPATIGVPRFEARVIDGWIQVRATHKESP